MKEELGIYTGTTYMIVQNEHQGLTFAKLYDPEQELIYMSKRNIENLTIELFSQVSN